MSPLGHDIGPAEDHQEVDGRGPACRCPGAPRARAGRPRHRAPSRPARSSDPLEQAVGQRAAVARLLPAEADRPGARRPSSRRKRAGVSGSAAAAARRSNVARARRERDLLLEHDVDQRGEARMRDPTTAAGRSGPRSRRDPGRAPRARRPPARRGGLVDRLDQATGDRPLAETGRRERVERRGPRRRAARPGRSRRATGRW